MVRTRPLLAVLALVAATAACSSSGGSAPSDPGGSTGSATSAAKGPRYVALGDSYTAGPQLNPTDSSSGACLRSTKNYAHLVAKAIDAASFTDASCSGATTDNVLEAAPTLSGGDPVPAQIDAVKKDTQLVTVGIGGNDSALFSSLSAACTRPGTACEDYLDDKVPGILRSTGKRITTVLEAVKDRAPDARVVLVGYLGVTPEDRGCDALGGDALDTAGVSAGERSIDSTMAAAAKAAGATYVSMNAASKGHDACAGDDAWTNGLSPALGDGAVLHPRGTGMAAVASAVEKVVAAS
ncbi:SGNH/GDSL hydrolase family protein [Aeromicrobium chenweiae]|uniref:GDSL family lipase n=1 Tax=Aeromicrobium chenweiae TaxID=2079793 RepID=A0A2S0WN62_9ACTN|nr:SGNH/GDSL hydrolase family protein [Aeromicrobium chenweiae]AWB92751.1 GDSL family lipase [Aeromicrobium chenweiae]TGN33743.1 SGNH/GDSL hydrolase family protein [Aeromicrobium chenweiae]